MTDEITPPGDGQGTGGTPPPPAARTLTQDDLDRVATAEAAKGKRAGARQLAEELGFGSVDELKAAIAQSQSRDDAELSEAQRLMKAAEAKEAKAAETEAKATETLTNARIERALESEGVPAKQSSKVRRLVEDIDAESTDEEIAAAVTKLKADMPSVFTVAANGEGEGENEGENGDEGAQQPRPVGSVPPPPPRPAPAGGKSGADVFRDRHPELTKSQ